MRVDPRDDQGTVLVLLLGFTAVLLLMVAVVVNVSSVILAKRALVSAADGAAVAAAQELDLDALHAGGLGSGRIPLSRAQVAQRVEAYEQQVGQDDVDLTGDVSADGTTAIVRAVRQVELPFGRMLGFAPVRVEAEARARAPTRP
jgi:uncharacterized membrane protein